MNSIPKHAKLMLMRVVIAGAIAAIVAVAYAPSALAFGGGGVGGIGGIAGIGGIHGNPAGGFAGVNGGQFNGIMINPVPNLAVQEMRELRLAGQVPANPERLPSGARTIQLKVNGQFIPMALDSELGSGQLEFNPGNRYGEELYNAVLTKQIAVLGDSKLRNQIVQAAAANSTQPLEIQGYVFNRQTPYFVVKSVETAK